MRMRRNALAIAGEMPCISNTTLSASMCVISILKFSRNDCMLNELSMPTEAYAPEYWCSAVCLFSSAPHVTNSRWVWIFAAISSMLVGFLTFFLDSFLAPAMVAHVLKFIKSGGGLLLGGGFLMDPRRAARDRCRVNRQTVAFELRGRCLTSVPDHEPDLGVPGCGRGRRRRPLFRANRRKKQRAPKQLPNSRKSKAANRRAPPTTAGRGSSSTVFHLLTGFVDPNWSA